ncbi:hypothetical protein JCM10212_000348 [Sporobolomyces blumeae]
MSPPSPTSDYGSELDYSDLDLIQRLDSLEVPSAAAAALTASSSSTSTPSTSLSAPAPGPALEQSARDNVPPQHEVARDANESGDASARVNEPEVKEVERLQDANEEPTSLWEKYRKRRGWGGFSVSDFAAPSWCEMQHTYRLASKAHLPPLERPATIETASGTIITIDQTRTIKRENILDGGKLVHAKIEKAIMGDVVPIKVEVEGKESWWALRILNMIVSLLTLHNTGKVRELPVVAFVGQHLIFGVIDEIERRTYPVVAAPPPPLPLPLPFPTTPPSRSSSRSSCRRDPTVPSTPKRRNVGVTLEKKKNHARAQTRPHATKPDPPQRTLESFFSPSPTKTKTPRFSPSTRTGREGARQALVGRAFNSDDAFMDLTNEDDEADLAALEAIEALERDREREAEAYPTRTRVGYVVSDTKTRYNPTIPPPSETTSARMQLMLYHRMFTSLVQPSDEDVLSKPSSNSEPTSTEDSTRDTTNPPTRLPTSTSTSTSTGDDSRPMIPEGPFSWRRLYAHLSLDPSAPLPETFLAALRPVIVDTSTELAQLVLDASTLGEFVVALGEVNRKFTRGERCELVEDDLEITYALRERGGFQGSRSAKKKKQQKEEEEEQRREKEENATEGDEGKGGHPGSRVERSVRATTPAQTTGLPLSRPRSGSPSTLGETLAEPDGADDASDSSDAESQTPFLANPSLSIPYNLPPATPEAVDGMRAGDGPVPPKSPFSLPATSQGATGIDETRTPRSNGRYNLRPNPSTTTEQSQGPDCSPSTKRPETPRSRIAQTTTSSPSPPSSPPRPTPAPVIIGTTVFQYSSEQLLAYLDKVLSYWHSERPAIGVSIEQVSRCRSCEFEDGCEWRKLKADEAERINRSKREARERRERRKVEEREERIRRGNEARARWAEKNKASEGGKEAVQDEERDRCGVVVARKRKEIEIEIEA